MSCCAAQDGAKKTVPHMTAQKHWRRTRRRTNTSAENKARSSRQPIRGGIREIATLCLNDMKPASAAQFPRMTMKIGLYGREINRNACDTSKECGTRASRILVLLAGVELATY
jgi:hypothetical protein